VPEEIQVPAVPSSDTLTSPKTPELRDRRITPEGVVPKQAQGYVVAGLAVLILVAVMFSKNHAKPAAKFLPTAVPFSNDANARKIAELEQNLSAEQRQSQQQLQQHSQRVEAGVIGPVNTTERQLGAQATPAVPSPPAADPQRDPVADAERAIAFKARFASNLVSADVDDSRQSPPSADSAEAIVRAHANGDRTSAHPMDLQSASTSTDGEQKRAAEVSVNAAHGQPYVLFEGTTIDTTLLNRLNGDFAGPVKVMVTNAIYNHDNQHVLIPEGSLLLGDVQKVSGLGQRRLAVTFHRMIMPDGYSVDLDRFHGLNQIGETGLNDKVNNHYLEIFGTSIALGVIAGAAEATTSSGYNESGSEAMRQGMAESLSASAAHVLDRFINIVPTITIREGHRIKVYLTQDLLLPAYENHAIPGDF
jgi:type IV secretory pathway VirB10-like protein